MKILVNITFALLLVTIASKTAMADDVISVAVLDFEAKDEAVAGMGPKVASLVSASLSAEPQIMTVERADLEKVLSEQELGAAGNVTPDTAAKVGTLTGAKVLVTGRIFKVDSSLVMVAKIIGTETSRVYGELVKGGPNASLTDLSSELAGKIAADVVKKADTLTAKVETHDEMIEKLKQLLGDKKRPSVSVNITEQHFGQPVIDPAAQTEMQLILQQCGFQVKDNASPDKADIDMTGEAFSEYGLRKGNLQSCRARIEIKVRNRATGELIVVDRQTSAAVDIAEHVAAKTALQNAAAELAKRTLPKLLK